MQALTVREAADALGCTTQRVYALIKGGRLESADGPCRMVTAESVEAYMSAPKGKGGRPRKS